MHLYLRMFLFPLATLGVLPSIAEVPVLAATKGQSAEHKVAAASDLQRVEIDLDPSLETKAWDWIIQKVVVDKQGQVLACDPYCAPTGTTLRALKPGEALPYYRRDYYKGVGMQRHDAYPVRDPSGELWMLTPFDYKPYLEFNLLCDGYDAYQVREGWVSAPHTLDGGGFSTTFFGAGGKPYNGWTFFPTAMFKQDPPQSGTAPCAIAGVYWEHNGQDFPGQPPAKASPYEARWDFIPQFLFSGIDPDPARRKRMDTIRSVHGHFSGFGVPVKGHVEVTYFTQLYGCTRWEVWTPKEKVEADEKLRNEAARVRAESCDCDTEIVYLGVPYVVTACRDWSEVEVLKTPVVPPAWPLAPMNLLKNFHFSRTLSHWNAAPECQWKLSESRAPLDARYVQAYLGGTGVQALVIQSEKAGSQSAVWQDVPVAGAVTDGEYTWGVNARTLTGGGSLTLTLEQVDAEGKRLSIEQFSRPVTAGNSRYSGNESSRLSAQYLSNHTFITMNPKSRFLRFGIQADTSGDYQILEAWLMKQSY